MAASSTRRSADWLQAQWDRISPWQLLLLPLALVFWLLSASRKLGYRFGLLAAVKLPVPVIVVGNIAVGGTGKTPLVIWLVEFLRQSGYTPGVISRGYGSSAREPTDATPVSDPAIVGDEPALIAQRTHAPVCVGRDRVAAARRLLDAHPECDVIVSDDGLQHYRLARAFEIVVVDGERWFGNGLLLPAGPLRESQARLNDADAVVINTGAARVRTEQGFSGMLPATLYSMRLSGQVLDNVKRPEIRARAADLRGKTLHAIAGIGNPARFFEQLRSLGLTFVPHPFPDHYWFTADDLEFAPECHVVMTEKDAVKCKPFAHDNCWSLAVSAEIDAAFGELVLRKLRRTYGPQTA